MMTFKNYLIENPYRKDWKISQVSTSISATASKGFSSVYSALENNGLLFRGFSGSIARKTQIIDASKSVRVSRDTNNIYQLMMDVSDSFSAYPSRSKSFICSSDLSYAKAYSGTDDDVFVLIPQNKKVAVLGEGDIFGITLKGEAEPFRNVARLGANIKNCFYSQSKFSKPKFTVEDIPEIDKIFSKMSAEEILFQLWRQSAKADLLIDFRAMPAEIDFLHNSSEEKIFEYLKEYGPNTELGERIISKLNANKSKRFEALSSIIVTPKNLNTSLQLYGTELERDRECWISGKVLVIPSKDFKQFILDCLVEGKKIHPNIISVFNL